MEESCISPDQNRTKCLTLCADDDGVTDWVQKVFVGPGVEGGEIKVIDLFPVYHHVIQLDGIGASTEERVPGFEPGEEFEGIDELANGVILLLDSFSFAFPHDHDAVTFGEQSIFLTSGGFVLLKHGLVTHLVRRLVVVWETLGTTVPEATIEFVHGTGSFLIPVYVEGLVSAQDDVFASIASVPNVDVGFSVEVREPFQSSERMGLTWCMPPTDGFRGQGAFLQVFGAVEEVAGRVNGDASFQQVEAADLFEFLAKDLAGSFQEEYVGFADSANRVSTFCMLHSMVLEASRCLFPSFFDMTHIQQQSNYRQAL